MKYLNKIATSACFAALGMLMLTGCEGAELYSIGSPDWLSEKVDSIKNSKSDGGEEELEGMMEDVYTIGKADFTSGFWTLGKTYVIPAGEKWQAQFNLTVNPDNKYFKNFYLVLNKFNGDLSDEFGVIRFDNDPTKNSEWNTTGTEIDRSLVGGDFNNSSGDDDIDASVQKMNGKITVIVDRADGGLSIKMSNGTLTKTYTQTSSFPSTGADADICCRIGIEGSVVNFLSTNIEPIGGCTSAEDKQPLSIEVSGIPSEVLLGTPYEEAFANVIATVTFEEGVTKDVTFADLVFEAIPDFYTTGEKTLVIMYNKTFKGENCDKPVVALKTFKIVNEFSAFTETLVVPNPVVLGVDGNTTGWWTVFTENIKVEPKETKVVNFTNYSSGVNNWNNFVIILNKADATQEYAVVRADNYGWGNGYAACTQAMEPDRDWAAWLAAMNGAKVTAYITNNGDGTVDIKAVMTGNDGKTYTQDYIGINTIDPDDFYFRFTVDGSQIKFDSELGASNCSTGWWTAFTNNVKVSPKQVCTVNFTNYSSGVSNWNNFVVILNKADATQEYAVVRADNYGWGNGYAACTLAMEPDRDWATWLPAMNGAKVQLTIANNGDGTADIKAVMTGNNGKTYTQDYTGINTIDPDDFYFRFTVDGSHIVFE